MGALAHTLLMLALYAMYRQNMVWFIFWEEATELLLIGVVGAMLWVFQDALLPGRTAPRPTRSLT